MKEDMKALKFNGVVSLIMMLCIFSYFVWCKACLDDEKEALHEIMDSIGLISETPEFSEDCCQWEGVDCSLNSSHVIRIFFYYVRKEEEEQDLWFLDMDLFAQLAQLQELHLRGNHIGGLRNSEALCKMKNLQHLDLSDNWIEDDLPVCLANLSSLRNLKLSNNLFRGDLSILSNLSNIQEVDVSHNHFQGIIPLFFFANLSKLTYLDLSYNYHLEVESEYPIWHPSFQIQHLFLAKCNLNNQSRHVIPGFISTQTNLQVLDLSDNLLEGHFPSWLLYNVSSVLSLRGNSFVGQFPLIHGTAMPSKLVELDISGNLFHGTLPQNINLFLPRLYNFNASFNQFSGTIPPSLGILQKLEHLDLSSNNLSGVIPTGLTTNTSLWYLNLSNNSFTGDLLPEDCSMRNLKWLLLHTNRFSGTLPACLSNSLPLLVLDVRNNSLSGQVYLKMPVFSKLGAFLLGHNQFSGIIPKQLCHMQKLQLLDLSRNSFSGSIPSCLSENLVWRKKFQSDSWVPIDFTTKGNMYPFQGLPLSLMTGIDLSENKLTGSIPGQIGDLQELHSLNFSYNSLTGEIPPSFKNLKNLESLDLSHNKLTGHIPQDFVHMSSLTTFRVAFNDLSGRIPYAEQSSTFTASSYTGNPKLCGEPLEKECTDHFDDDREGDNIVDSNQKEKKEANQEDDSIIDQPIIFYSFVFMSFSLGFWTVIAPLCLSRSWRRKYYMALDRLMDGWF